MKSQVRGAVAVMVLAALAGVVLMWRAYGRVAGLELAVAVLLPVVVYGGWALRTGRHTTWGEALPQVAEGRAVVLWKPGCPYCERLLRALGDNERVVWVNVWKDADANRRVRELNDGNEYTPTVLVGDEVLRNPDAAAVRTALASTPDQRPAA